VRVQHALDTLGDYVFLGGLPPDQVTRYGWSWKEEPIQPALGGFFVEEMEIEAYSPTTDEQTSADEFTSGILFGVAAAAIMAAVQEFVRTATARRRPFTGD